VRDDEHALTTFDLRCNRVQPVGNEAGYSVFETLRLRDLLYRKAGIASIPGPGYLSSLSVSAGGGVA